MENDERKGPEGDGNPDLEETLPFELDDVLLDKIAGGAGSGSGAGKVTPQDFHFTKLNDKTTP